MGECGCYTNGARYKLPGPNGILYYFKLLPACDYCDVGASIQLTQLKPDQKKQYETELQYVPFLPVTYECDGEAVCVIEAGPTKRQVVKAGEQSAFEEIDAIASGVLAEAMWDALPQKPVALQPRQDKERDD
jgi:hypothetical protein